MNQGKLRYLEGFDYNFRDVFLKLMFSLYLMQL